MYTMILLFCITGIFSPTLYSMHQKIKLEEELVLVETKDRYIMGALSQNPPESYKKENESYQYLLAHSTIFIPGHFKNKRLQVMAILRGDQYHMVTPNTFAYFWISPKNSQEFPLYWRGAYCPISPDDLKVARIIMEHRYGIFIKS